MERQDGAGIGGRTVRRTYEDGSLALHTDLYEINMLKTYWEQGITEKHAVFEAYYRNNPFGNGFTVYAGLERVVKYIENLRFSESDLAYLREEGLYEEAFIDYLRNWRF